MAVQPSLLDSLAQLALFADLPRPQLERLVHTFDEEVFAPDHRVLRRGMTGGGLYVIVSGEAAVVIEGVERQRLYRGDFFGEISALTGSAPIADIVAVGLLRCFVIPTPDLEPFLLERPQVTLRLLKMEAQRLRVASQWAE